MKRQFQPVIFPFLTLLFFLAGSASPAFSQQGIITTFAGGGPNSPVALSAEFVPVSVALDASGNIYIAGSGMQQVFKVDPAGNFTVVAGTGTYGYSGDGGPATKASLYYPLDVAVDTHGNLFISDVSNFRVRRVDAATGIITTVAGGGQSLGDGVVATSADLHPGGLAVDAHGNLLIADVNNCCIRRVDAVTGIITTVAGNGQQGFSGDGGPAINASLSQPDGVALDAQGNLFFADTGNQRVRRVEAATGIITTVAGNGIDGFGGDGGLATNASLAYPLHVTVDAQGSLLIADGNNFRVRHVDAVTRIITTVAGNGSTNFNGDGGAATSAALVPNEVAVDAQGNLIVADAWNRRVRRVDAVSGTIQTVAGRATCGSGGTATNAVLFEPAGIAVDRSGNVFFSNDECVSRVDAAGTIMTAAGSIPGGSSGDGGSATSAKFLGPVGVAVDPDGNLFIVDGGNGLIRRVDVVTGIVTTVAEGFRLPVGMTLNARGDLFVADTYDHRVRRVDAVTGAVTTLAGGGVQPNQSGYTPAGSIGDGGQATSAGLAYPYGVAVDAQGNILIADTNNCRIRRVDAVTGIITTVAGTGQPGLVVDGVAAATGVVLYPRAIALDAFGNMFISAGGRVRRVDAVTGLIGTVAGNDIQGYSGDGGPATGASLGLIQGVVVDAKGRLFIADPYNNRVRAVTLPAFVAFSPAALSFPTQAKGTTSSAQTVTLTNTGTAPLTVSSIALAGTNAGDFASTNTCGSSVKSGAICVISVTYTPAATGASTATLTITDNAPGSPHAVLLSGTTQAPDFTLAASGSSTSATVSAGQSALYTLSLTPRGNLSGTVSLTCSGAPVSTSCTVNPASVNLNGAGATTIVVTAIAAVHSAPRVRMKPPAGPWIWLWLLVLVSVSGAALVDRRHPAWQRICLPMGVAMVALLLWAACGGGANEGGAIRLGPAPGTYPLTITGTLTSGTTTVQHSITVSLTVK